jgi:predicted MPP superfamily phosphohydrolase
MGHAPHPPPGFLGASIYIWHILVLPLTAAALLLTLIGWAVIAVVRCIRCAKQASHPPLTIAFDSVTDVAPEKIAAPTRRQVLAGMATAIPPLLALGATGVGLNQLNNFRVRSMRLSIPTLPLALEGMTIAHVTDLHIGRFTGPSVLPRIVATVNSLNSDLVLMTGDLIDYALDDLPAGIETLRQMNARHGLFLCEGNHDLFQSRSKFETRVLQCGLDLLLNGTANLRINQQEVQVMGIRWGYEPNRNDVAYATHVERTLTLRRQNAFPILLAHHPHAFDPAAEAQIPLILSGHTHGGQLMLTENIGAGPIMFKYWSGLYQKDNGSQLVVSNGTGNWFPLRVNAPAEIVHLTLVRGPASQSIVHPV